MTDCVRRVALIPPPSVSPLGAAAAVLLQLATTETLMLLLGSVDVYCRDICMLAAATSSLIPRPVARVRHSAHLDVTAAQRIVQTTTD